MNAVSTFLRNNWARLGMHATGTPPHFSFVMKTPRFRASKHVVFMVLMGNSPVPVLVVKVPRLDGDSEALEREAANLEVIHGLRTGGFATIPRLVAFEDYFGRRLLIESALIGRVMRPSLVRRQPDAYLDAALEWLVDLHSAKADMTPGVQAWFQRLVERPLTDFECVFPLRPEERDLVQQTRELTRSLQYQSIPLVFEHGDFSSPNILLMKNGSIGVLDWELADPEGLPAVDLFFFLTYVAFARRNAHKDGSYVPAFHEAFCGPRAWARPYVTRYAERLQLAPEAIRSLFVLCWSRYVTRYVTRLGSMGNDPRPAWASETAEWLRRNRYFALWRHAVQRPIDLTLVD